MLADQEYGGHSSIHDDAMAEKLGFRAGPIEGPTHFSLFPPLLAQIWGQAWFERGCISAHYQNMVVEGEEFAVGAAIVHHYLSIVALKDVLIERQAANGRGKTMTKWVPAGEGMVDWTAVFAELKRLKYDGPLSVHCEFEVAPDRFMETVKREFAFFKQQRGEQG